MTDTEPLIVATDPNAPKVWDLGEDGTDYVVENTSDPATAERALLAYAVANYDDETRDGILARIPQATFTPGIFWWKAEAHVDGAELVDVTKEFPPALFHGVRIDLGWSEL